MISRARIEIEAMRLMVLQAAKAMDVLGNQEARIWVHMVKAMVPERVCQIIDQAIQIHGATGVSQWTPLAGNVHRAAYPASRRRAGRGSPPGGGPGRAQEVRRVCLGASPSDAIKLLRNLETLFENATLLST